MQVYSAICKASIGTLVEAEQKISCLWPIPSHITVIMNTGQSLICRPLLLGVVPPLKDTTMDPAENHNGQMETPFRMGSTSAGLLNEHTYSLQIDLPNTVAIIIFGIHGEFFYNQ